MTASMPARQADPVVVMQTRTVLARLAASVSAVQPAQPVAPAERLETVQPRAAPVQLAVAQRQWAAVAEVVVLGLIQMPPATMAVMRPRSVRVWALVLALPDPMRMAATPGMPVGSVSEPVPQGPARTAATLGMPAQSVLVWVCLALVWPELTVATPEIPTQTQLAPVLVPDPVKAATVATPDRLPLQPVVVRATVRAATPTVVTAVTLVHGLRR